MAKYLFYRRKTAIIFTDIALFSIGFSIWGVLSYKYHWSIGIVTFLILFFATNYLFFSNRIFRYLFSIVFSAVYGAFFYAIGYYVVKENPTTPAMIFGVLAFLISLWLHKDHFDFLKGAKTIEYDKY